MTIPTGLRPHFRALGWLGALLLAGDTWLSARFGLSISWEMSVIFAAISIASGLLLVASLYFSRRGVSVMARGLAAAWGVALLANVWSNIGVATANRMNEVQTARVQQTTYDGRRRQISEAEASLTLFTRQLEDLLAQHAWAATVTADGLREQAATLARAIREEGDARNGGCRRKCLDLMNRKAEIDQRIAVAEQRADLTGRIEATRRVLADLRGELAGTKAGISHTANQSALYAKLISWNLADDPDGRMVTVANEATGVMSAVVLALLSAVVTLAAAWPHLADVRPDGQGSVRPATPVSGPRHGTDRPMGAPSPVSAMPMQSVPQVPVTADVYVVKDDAAERLRASIRQALGGTPLVAPALRAA